MFNKSLKNEFKALKEELYSLNQVKESLDQEMLVIILSPEGVITSVNKKFTDELAFSKEAIIGRKISELVPVISRETTHYKGLLNSIKNASHWVGALEIEKENGDEAWLRVILQPVLDGEKR